jgi:biopolymer transport protein ExbD
MGVKKRSKVSASFNMSSLTDIIFLLLIFFMLTSSMVMPNALNLQLPGTRTPVNINMDSKPSSIDIEYDGSYYLNGQRISISSLEQQLSRLKRQKGRDAVISITPSGRASNDAVVKVLDIAYKLELKSILNDPK